MPEIPPKTGRVHARASRRLWFVASRAKRGILNNEAATLLGTRTLLFARAARVEALM